MADESDALHPRWTDESGENPGPFSQSGKPHGKGMLTYVVPPEREEEGGEEGKRPDVFVGDMVEGVRDGHGVYTWSNGASYSGPYAVGKKHGKDGHLTLPDGASYKGTFVNGTIAGKGLMRYKNGDVYEGGLHDGVAHGPGCYHFASDMCQFVGTFEHGAFKSGRWVWTDGSFCHAAFKEVSASGKSVYVPTGHGTRYFGRAGLQQEGDFQEGTWVGGPVTVA